MVTVDVGMGVGQAKVGVAGGVWAVFAAWTVALVEHPVAIIAVRAKATNNFFNLIPLRHRSSCTLAQRCAAAVAMTGCSRSDLALLRTRKRKEIIFSFDM